MGFYMTLAQAARSYALVRYLLIHQDHADLVAIVYSYYVGNIMVTMTTVSMVICHTHLIAMLYYCGYLLQAGEIG